MLLIILIVLCWVLYMCFRRLLSHRCCQCLSGLTVIRQESRVTEDAPLFLPFYLSFSSSLCFSISLCPSNRLRHVVRLSKAKALTAERWLGVWRFCLYNKNNIDNTDTGQYIAVLVMLPFSFWHRSPANMSTILDTVIMPEGETAWTGFRLYYSNLIRRINICQSCGWRHTRWNGACLIHTISA